MVPKLPDWYIIPREVVRVCEHAKLTTPTSQPMRNFLFRGEAGTGKTMGAQAIAAGLHLPYTLMTCSANTEISDLIGQFIPDSGSDTGVNSNLGELPKISDIIMHPPSVYQALTGVYDDDKTEDDVLEKLIEIAVGRLAVKEEKHGQRIRYVDTPLIEAIRYGYVCELQEPSCIANPGVLVGLNSLLDNCQTITLPTGERVKRHPDKQHRQAWKEEAHSSLDDFLEVVGEPDDSGTSILWSDIELQITQQQIELLRLRAMGFTPREIALMQQCSSNAIHCRFKRIKKKLKRAGLI